MATATQRSRDKAAAIKKRIDIPLKYGGPPEGRGTGCLPWRSGSTRPLEWKANFFAVLQKGESITPSIVRRPDKTELEFAIVAACMALPAGYWLVRTLFSRIAG